MQVTWSRPSRAVHARYPDARKYSQHFVVTGGGPQRLGCVYRLHHRSSGKVRAFRLLRELHAFIRDLGSEART